MVGGWRGAVALAALALAVSRASPSVDGDLEEIDILLDDKRQRESDLIAGFHTSRHRCPNGHSGLLIMLHEHAPSAAEYRADLEKGMLTSHKEVNLFHRLHESVKAISMLSIHPQTLRHVARHEHTRHIEANCIIQQSLPKPKPIEGMSQLFEGRYFQVNSTSLCTHVISVAQPYASNSTAVLTVHSPAPGQSNCKVDGQDGPADQTVSYSAVIKVLRPHYGQIVVQAGALGPNNAMGTYTIDPNGRISDGIKWVAPGAPLEAFNWTKVPGPVYNKNSSIGPLDDGLGTRKRNPKAFMRWNWALDRISHGQNATLTDTYAHGGALGENTTLYNLDTGVMISHDDFGGRAVPGFSSGCPTGTEMDCLTDWVYQGVITESVMMRDGQGMGCESHGTHTSSTAAGTLYGVASKARIVAVQVLGCTGGGTDAAVLEGMEWAANDYLSQTPRRPSVVAMSLGGGARSDVLDAAAKRLNDLGMLVVVAAGNAGTDSCLGSPAGAAEALTVGATGMSEPQLENGELLSGVPAQFDTKASFSDDGSCVNIFAPGVEMLAAIPSKDGPHFASAMSGTSMATPVVAGIALQIWSLHPTMSSEDVTRAIYCLAVQGTITGVPTHTRNWLAQGGAQILDPRMSALIAAQQELTPEQRKGQVKPKRDATQCYVPPPPAEAAAAAAVSQWEADKQRMADAAQAETSTSAEARADAERASKVADAAAKEAAKEAREQRLVAELERAQELLRNPSAFRSLLRPRTKKKSEDGPPPHAKTTSSSTGAVSTGAVTARPPRTSTTSKLTLGADRGEGVTMSTGMPFNALLPGQEI